MLLLMLGLVTIVILVFTSNKPKVHQTSWKELNTDIEKGYVEELYVVGMSKVEGTYIDSPKHGHQDLHFAMPYTGDGQSNLLTPEVLERWSNIQDQFDNKFELKEGGAGFWTNLLGFLPWLILFIVIRFVLLSQMRAASGKGVMQFGRSKARMHF